MSSKTHAQSMRESLCAQIVDETRAFLRQPNIVDAIGNSVLGGHVLTQMDAMLEHTVVPVVQEDLRLAPPEGQEYNDKLAIFPVLPTDPNPVHIAMPPELRCSKPLRGFGRIFKPAEVTEWMPAVESGVQAVTVQDRINGRPARPVIILGAFMVKRPSMVRSMICSHEVLHAVDSRIGLALATQELRAYHMNYLQGKALIGAGMLTEHFDVFTERVENIRRKYATAEKPFNGSKARRDLVNAGALSPSGVDTLI